MSNHRGQGPSGESISNDEGAEGPALSRTDFKNLAIRLYLSHFLSTWNSRMFEFAAFLFLAGVFPGTLLFVSIYALARSFAVFLLASPIGEIMDKANRLATIRQTIGEQHTSSPQSACCRRHFISKLNALPGQGTPVSYLG